MILLYLAWVVPCVLCVCVRARCVVCVALCVFFCVRVRVCVSVGSCILFRCTPKLVTACNVQAYEHCGALCINSLAPLAPCESGFACIFSLIR